MSLTEINFDGIVGPSHNYAGLSLGNLAATKNAGAPSYPREAALQGIAKMRGNMALGLAQGFFGFATSRHFGRDSLFQPFVQFAQTVFNMFACGYVDHRADKSDSPVLLEDRPARRREPAFDTVFDPHCPILNVIDARPSRRQCGFDRGIGPSAVFWVQTRQEAPLVGNLGVRSQSEQSLALVVPAERSRDWVEVPRADFGGVVR